MSRQPTFRLLACLVGLAWLIAPPASATPITVNNASFENHSPDEQTVNDWTEDLNPPSIVGHTALAGEYTAVPDGSSVAILFNSARMSQTLTDTLTSVAGSRYDLTVAVGDRTNKVFAGYFIRLFAGADLLATESSGTSPGDGKFTDVALSYVTTGAESAIGQALKIELAIPAVSLAETSFDNVRLDFTSGSQPPPTGVPAPSTVASLMLGLAALGAVRRRRRHGELSGAHFR